MAPSPCTTAVPSLALDEALADFVISQVRRTFGEMFLTEISSQRHSFDVETALAGDISGNVGLIQDEYEGSLSLSFERNAILALMAGIYGTRHAELDKPIRDGVGEITNILFCIFKKRLNDSGHRLRMAIPTVIVGPSHCLFGHHEHGRSLTIAFQLPEGKFFVRIVLQRRRR